MVGCSDLDSPLRGHEHERTASTPRAELAKTAWRVAEHGPKGLKAIILWERYVDMYSDPSYHDGMLEVAGVNYLGRWRRGSF